MIITIEKFQQLFNIANSNMDEVDKSIAFIQIISGKSQADIEKMSIDKFNRVCKMANAIIDESLQKSMDKKPSQYFWVGMRPFFINYDISKLPAGKYIEISHYGSDIIGNLHKIMASLVYEVQLTWKGFKVMPYDASRHQEISELMLKANFKHCYDISVFFYLVFKNSILNLRDYLEQKSQNPELVEKALTGFKEITDGFRMPKWYQNSKISV